MDSWPDVAHGFKLLTQAGLKVRNLLSPAPFTSKILIAGASGNISAGASGYISVLTWPHIFQDEKAAYGTSPYLT